jgi:hypothetical protein
MFVGYDKTACQGLQRMVSQYAGEHLPYRIPTAAPRPQEEQAGAAPGRKPADIREVEVQLEEFHMDSAQVLVHLGGDGAHRRGSNSSSRVSSAAYAMAARTSSKMSGGYSANDLLRA